MPSDAAVIADIFKANYLQPGQRFYAVKSALTSKAPEYYASWRDGAWTPVYVRELQKTLVQTIAEVMPDAKSITTLRNESLLLIDSLAEDTLEADWNQSVRSIPLADGAQAVCLLTGRAAAADPDELMLERLPVEAAELAAAPAQWPESRFKRMLDEWHDEPDRWRYLQAACGQALAGNPAHTITDNVGVGRNGKGAFIGFLRAALGAYAVTIDPSFFAKDGGVRHEAGLVPLKDARIAVIGEFESSARINTALLKNVSAGDEMMVSNKGGKPFRIRPQAMPFLHGNSELSVNDVSVGIQDRWKRLQWTFRMEPGARVDPAEMAAIAEAERGVVLWWMLAGLQRWRERGYAGTGAVEADTAAYFGGENTASLLLEYHCEPAPGESLPTAALVRQANEDGAHGANWTTRSLNRKLKEMGLELERDRRGSVILHGYRLLVPAEASEPARQPKSGALTERNQIRKLAKEIAND